MSPSYPTSRGPSGSQSRRQRGAPQDRHHNIKTSLHVISMIICLRVLLPQMFPSEQDPEQQHQQQQQQQRRHSSRSRGQPYYDTEDEEYQHEYPPEPQRRISYPPPEGDRAVMVMRDRKRISDRSEWGGETVVDVDEEEERDVRRRSVEDGTEGRRRRERRRERERERERERDRVGDRDIDRDMDRDRDRDRDRRRR